MTDPIADHPKLLAVSDLHTGYTDNRELVEKLQPDNDQDWLIVAGDVGEKVADIQRTLADLRQRFHTVVWVPGNHELWTHPADPVKLRGEERYRHLVEICRELGVFTPEDPYQVWTGPAGPVTVAPLFVLYDYTFLPPGVLTQEAALELAYETGIVCTDEQLLHPDPYPSRAEWCHARIEYSLQRLDSRDPKLPTVLINHFPLTRLPTLVLRYPQFAQWCGTELTHDWHVRYDAAAVVYGHLHIPRTTYEDGVRFEEVSLGYPREWRPRGRTLPWPRQILPAPA
ncbi:MAG: metallophosphoesterase [Actinomycetota bacterium]|nr:metallophosphoesterase [Actinomycetota bacterium]MDQ2958323.1 metallophosphoesterase [Actinomycetota bacterium]